MNPISINRLFTSGCATIFWISTLRRSRIAGGVAIGATMLVQVLRS
jgi:hypothetical protein